VSCFLPIFSPIPDWPPLASWILGEDFGILERCKRVADFGGLRFGAAGILYTTLSRRALFRRGFVASMPCGGIRQARSGVLLASFVKL
jgi:hypothetical protein